MCWGWGLLLRKKAAVHQAVSQSGQISVIRVSGEIVNIETFLTKNVIDNVPGYFRAKNGINVKGCACVAAIAVKQLEILARKVQGIPGEIVMIAAETDATEVLTSQIEIMRTITQEA